MSVPITFRGNALFTNGVPLPTDASGAVAVAPYTLLWSATNGVTATVGNLLGTGAYLSSGSTLGLTTKAMTALTSTGVGGTAVLQSGTYLPLLPGVTTRVSMCVTMNAGSVGGGQTLAGLMDTENGVAWAFDATDGPAVQIAGAGAGSVLSVPRASWNGNKLDGSGAGGLVVAFNSPQLLFIELQWRSANLNIVFGVVVDDVDVVAHTMTSATNAMLPSAPVQWAALCTSGGDTAAMEAGAVSVTVGSPAPLAGPGGIWPGTTAQSWVTPGEFPGGAEVIIAAGVPTFTAGTGQAPLPGDGARGPLRLTSLCVWSTTPGAAVNVTVRIAPSYVATEDFFMPTPASQLRVAHSLGSSGTLPDDSYVLWCGPASALAGTGTLPPALASFTWGMTPLGYPNLLAVCASGDGSAVYCALSWTQPM